ncbi:MAG TPA: UvrD-helicase domain-containing protein [Rectinemataceae bacterium]|nr:UvrD-helicase domain-containing protein [Rectinemataceae bacterium]
MALLEVTAPNTSQITIARNLDRIANLQGLDAGLFVLAVHSFVEGWIRDRFALDGKTETFTILMNHFIGYAKKKNGGFVHGITSLNAMISAHDETNDVRHLFKDLDRQSAETASHHLERFCQLANVGSPEQLASIRKYLEQWNERKPVHLLEEENRRLSLLRGKDVEEKRLLVQRIAEMEGLSRKVEHLETAVLAKNKRIDELEGIAQSRGRKADAERQERANLEKELRGTRKQLEEYRKEHEYVSLVKKMTTYTRTRADYERMLIRLTADQQKVLEQIRLDADFLVKGAAGTGKTLVLLKAIEKAKTGGVDEARLDISELNGSVALLTYTNTLVKYDSYVASILSAQNGADKIQTADAFIKDRLAAIDPGAHMDYDIVEELAETYKPEGFSPQELKDEAELVIWGNDLSYESYVEGGFNRRGMKKAVAPKDRATLWAACEAMAAEMEARRAFSKGYSRVKLLRAIDANPEDPRLRCVDYIFIDEAQDLAAADLKALKGCARRCIVLAGDADQSIYQPGFSFKQAGIDIVGRSRILRSNFRNTFAIHELAEAYRKTIPGQDSENEPTAVRPGPAPELFQAKDRSELADLLVARVKFFIETLNYDPENICIIYPSKDDAELIKKRLEAEDIAAVGIRDKGFSFENEGQVRMTTFLSAKGLDFPVVLPFLYRQPWFGPGYDEASVDRMTRNLIYVGATRAMDHLNVFALEHPSSKAIADFVAAFGESDPARDLAEGA